MFVGRHSRRGCLVERVQLEVGAGLLAALEEPMGRDYQSIVKNLSRPDRYVSASKQVLRLPFVFKEGPS